MKSKLFLAVVALLLAVPFVAGSATVCGFDANARDTVRIGPVVVPVVTPGQIFDVPVYLFADEAIAAFTLGLKWSSPSNIRYHSAVINPAWTTDPYSFTASFDRSDTAIGLVGLGAYTFDTDNPIPASNDPQVIFTVKFQTKTGAVPALITIDSSFFPPGGPWLLSPASGATGDGICPEYVHAADLVDIRLPVQEFDGPVLPQTYSIDQNNPNPFNPTTSINFALPTAAKTRIDVFNILGQKVKTLVDEYLTAGNKRVEWDGTDDRGNAVASGIYLYKMTANDFTETKKMMLMK